MPLFAFSIQGAAASLGGVGLFIVTFLDSSFLSLPEAADLLLIWMVVQHKPRMLYYSSMATLGSIAGCFVLYYVTRKAGDAFVRRRFKAERIERGFQLFQRYGVLVLLIPSLLPPPSPFKIFVLLAGVVAISPVKFVSAIALGRGARYFGEGLLALWYGEQAMAFLRTHGLTMFLVATVLILALTFGRRLWRRPREAM
ncbi:MAG: VTT domain-containing protein [Acidobacteriota bacterium]|nr:VTT domain-containing protein [Acidobacteriota bacterium]